MLYVWVWNLTLYVVMYVFISLFIYLIGSEKDCWMIMVWKGLCNENQLDALFILSLFFQSTSKCFGHTWSPSSEGIPYMYNIYQLLYIYIYTVFFMMMIVLFSCYLCCSMYCLCVNVYCHRVTTQLQLINK
jgi:hypothetical protein